MPEPNQEPNAVAFLHENFVRRFDRELVWKDTLESKAVAFLGFVGIFITVLLTVTTALSLPASADFLPLLAFPMVLQVSSALLLFVVVFGYTVTVGPAVTDTFEARNNEVGFKSRSSWLQLPCSSSDFQSPRRYSIPPVCRASGSRIGLLGFLAWHSRC